MTDLQVNRISKYNHSRAYFSEAYRQYLVSVILSCRLCHTYRLRIHKVNVDDINFIEPWLIVYNKFLFLKLQKKLHPYDYTY